MWGWELEWGRGWFTDRLTLVFGCKLTATGFNTGSLAGAGKAVGFGSGLGSGLGSGAEGAIGVTTALWAHARIAGLNTLYTLTAGVELGGGFWGGFWGGRGRNGGAFT